MTADGGSAITERGVVYSLTSANNDPLVSGSGVTKATATGTTGVFTVPVAGLTGSSGHSFKAYAINGVGTTYTSVATFTTLVPNRAPTDIALSNVSLAENNTAGATVGTLSATDADAGDTFTFSLVAGTGGTDNAAFSIAGSALKISGVADFEAKNSYTVRVRATDAGGLFFEKAFAITVTDVNEVPVGATGVLSGSFAVYTAPSTGAGYGSFTYTLSDGHGHTATAMVTVTQVSVPPSAQAPNATSIAMVGSDVVLTYIGLPANQYRVQYTTSTGPTYVWQEFNPLAVDAAPANGVFTHIDVNPAAPVRLYRAVPHP